DRVVHSAVVGENLHHLGNRRPLLPDRTIDADQVIALVVDDGIDGNSGLAGLAVADDQLTLAAADRNHAVDGLQSGSHRLADRLPVNHSRRDAFEGDKLVGRNRPFAIDRLTERVDHAANHRIADGYAHDAAGALDLVTFLDFGVFAKQHDA